MQISFAVTAKLISTSVFATWIFPFLFFLNPNFKLQAIICTCRDRFVSDLDGTPNCWFALAKVQMKSNVNSVFQSRWFIVTMTNSYWPVIRPIKWTNSSSIAIQRSIAKCKIFFFFFFKYSFTSLSRLFQLIWDGPIRWAKTGGPREKPPGPPASRTWLVSHVASAGLQPTPDAVVRWSSD